MLKSLKIKDFAIIDELEVSFMPGLNIMTGETGAGKTIIVEAINLVMGARAEADHIRAGSDTASVTAVFAADSIPKNISKGLSDAGIECGDDIIVHRVISGSGRGRISINGVPVTGAHLKGVADHLVDVSSQHEHQLLLDQGEHVNVIDQFGRHDAVLADYADAHRRCADLQGEILSLESNEKQAKEKLEFLKFQLDEIEAAGLKPGEDVEIEAARIRLKHAVQLEEKARAAEALLYGNSGSALESIDQSQKLIAECVRYDASAAKWSEGLSRARAEIEEAARELSRYADGLESDPAALEEMEERLHLIRRLIKKHGGSVESCLAKGAALRSEIEAIANYDDIIFEKRNRLAEISERRRKMASVLRAQRKSAARRLCAGMEKTFFDLGLAKTKFSVNVEALPEDGWDESGPDRIEFLIAPNMGEPARPLAKIASGGELSRIMLALKDVLSDSAGQVGTSIFDEVDSGIGGAVAEVVGRKLRGVSRTRQVICITHLPQVAVHGDNHMKISKRVKGGRTVAAISMLEKVSRVDEIARMLGGTKITDATRAHAEEMLCGASS